jgi:hypothetical protein
MGSVLLGWGEFGVVGLRRAIGDDGSSLEFLQKFLSIKSA